MATQAPYDAFIQNFFATKRWEIVTTAIINAAIYGGIGAAILAGMYYFDAPEALWTPVLLVYAVAAVAHMIGESVTGIGKLMEANTMYRDLREAKREEFDRLWTEWMEANGLEWPSVREED